MRKLLATGAVLFLATTSFGQISGFSGFAPFNYTVSNLPATNASLGYSADGTSFALTSPAVQQATSGYFPTAQAIGSFTASFDYRTVYNQTGVDGNGNPNYNAADGISLNFINPSNGVTALGLPGSGRGIGGITTSASVQFDIYGGNTNRFRGQTGYSVGGVAPVWKGVSPATTLNNTLKVDLFYNNGVLIQRMTDNSNAVPRRGYATYAADIATAVGGSQALVGFSGATGNVTSTQTVSNFTFRPGVPNVTLPTFSPIGVGGFNHTLVVPKEATPEFGILYVDSTLDNGTNVSISNSGYTFFEQGLSGGPAGTGLPVGGSTFTSASSPQHNYRMPLYNSGGGDGATFAKDSILVSAAIPSATMTLTTPAAYSEISLLSTCGHGAVPVGMVLNYTDGTTLDLGSNDVQDWFGRGTLAVSTGARFNPGTGGYQTSAGNVNLFQMDFDVPETSKLISSISFSYLGTPTGAGVAAFFALSGYSAAAAAIPGDYNRDGFVDAADYTVWADHFGQSGTNVAGDGNNDGVVNAADYTVWADHFGQGTPHVGAVPEPGALALGLPVAGLLMGRRRR